MSRKRTSTSPNNQLVLDFDSIIKSAEVLSREDAAKAFVTKGSTEYDPVERTAEYMRRAVQFEGAWDTSIQQARNKLLETNAPQLFMEFILDLKKLIEKNTNRSPTLANLLEHVTLRGLGLPANDIVIARPSKGMTKWKVHIHDLRAIETLLSQMDIRIEILNSMGCNRLRRLSYQRPRMD